MNTTTKIKIKNIIMLIVLFLFTNLLIAQNITFQQLESFKKLSISKIQLSLKKNNYEYYTTINGGTQWKSKDGSGIVGANGKGLVLFMTYNYSLQKKIIDEMKKASYKNTGTTIENNQKVVSYEKERTTVLLSTTTNPDKGKLLYSTTIIYK
jgi:hypothetical protein